MGFYYSSAEKRHQLIHINQEPARGQGTNTKNEARLSRPFSVQSSLLVEIADMTNFGVLDIRQAVVGNI